MNLLDRYDAGLPCPCFTDGSEWCKVHERELELAMIWQEDDYLLALFNSNKPCPCGGDGWCNRHYRRVNTIESWRLAHE